MTKIWDESNWLGRNMLGKQLEEVHKSLLILIKLTCYTDTFLL